MMSYQVSANIQETLDKLLLLVKLPHWHKK